MQKRHTLAEFQTHGPNTRPYPKTKLRPPNLPSIFDKI